MSEFVVSFVVERIGDLLIEEAFFLAGVSDKVRQMQTELQRMQRFLKDADKRQDTEEAVRGWVSEIKELAYDAENVIESFALRVASRRENGLRNKCKRYATIFIEGAYVHKVGMEIEAIKARIIELTRSLTTYGVQFRNEPQGSTSLQQKLKRTYSHLVEEHTIGLDNDVKTILTKLVAEAMDVGEIVSICGMGGLGKTTLANKVYHHVSVRDHFEAFVWYCVSQQFHPRQVWEGILVKLVFPTYERRKEISKMNDDEIAKELYCLLNQNKKRLVVLDDIWNEDAWDLLKAAFPLGKAGCGTKIVLTTRNKTLAAHADPRAFVHELRTLNEHDSWELFQTKAFLNNINSAHKFNIGMKNLGMKIVKKCGGLPLAIIVLGGLLATKDSLTEWEKVHENVDSYLRGKRTHQEYSIVHGVLALSYNELPYHLKSCFLHLGNFPEDYDIPCKTLQRMWVAEGFVSQCQHEGERNETMEDVAEHYLNDLVDRSVVQVSQMRSIGKFKTCHLHDLMRDFCLLKANKESVQTPYLRSFLLFGHPTKNWELPRIKSSLIEFTFLRILRLERCRIEKKMEKQIGGLLHLRYLAIEDCEIEALPSSIGNLRYLQTLIIRRKDNPSIKLPNVIWKLEQLRHLVLINCSIDKPRRELLKLGNMRKLRTLECERSWFYVSNIDDVLVNSSHLKKLRLKIGFGVNQIPSVILLSSLCIRVTSTENLLLKIGSNEEELKLLFSRCPQLVKLYYWGRIENKLPEWQHFPSNLTKLKLKKCLLEEDPMPILEKLPNLRILRLHMHSLMGRSLSCSSKGFPKLQTLYLTLLPNLEEWSVDEEAMANLSQLYIQCCYELKMIPEGIKFITTLRQLEITDMPKGFQDRVPNADFYKVRHVPSIIVRDISVTKPGVLYDIYYS